MDRKRVVVIGGGTGTFTVLTGLRKYPELDLSVIVTMADSGGSNRILRDEFGLLPTSDIRQVIVALAETDNEMLRKLFAYRYHNGNGISGMTFGNLFMAALADITGSQKKAIEETCRLLSVRGHVIPVTFEVSNLVAEYENGVKIVGEHEIDEPDNRTPEKIARLYMQPSVTANPDAVTAILEADVVIIGPGDLYTSLICNLVVTGIPVALQQTKARLMYMANLMTRAGQTGGMTAADHVSEIEKYIGRPLDLVIMNNDYEIPAEAVTWYEQTGSGIVVDDLAKNVVRAPLVSHEVFEKAPSDKLIRSLVRHDSDKLAAAIVDNL